MLFLLILVIAAVAVALGRVMMGRWLNHLSLYSMGFGVSLAAYSLHWLPYSPISAEAWIVMVAGGAAVFLGSGAVLFTFRPSRTTASTVSDDRMLGVVIVVFSLVAAISLLLQVRDMRREFGGLLVALIEHSNDVYGYRMEGKLAGEPYLFLFAYPASALAGAFTASQGKLTLKATLPVLVNAIGGILSMQRSGLVISGILFVFAFIYSPRTRKFAIGKRLQWTVAVLLLLVTTMFLLIGGQRGMYAAFNGQKPVLTELSRHWRDIPTHYLYVSAPGPTLSQYMQRPEVAHKELFGYFTFQALYRLLAKCGFDTNVPYYPTFVPTPVSVNQATYLGYLFADFGAFGVVIVPFVACGLTTWLALRLKQRCRLGELMLYSHLVLCMAFAFTWYIIGATYFAVSMIVSTSIGIYRDRHAEHQTSEPGSGVVVSS